MNAKEAARSLEDVEVVAFAQAPIPQAKEIHAACLEADIPVVLGGGPGCKSGGCSPRAYLYAREADLPRLMSLLESRWKALLENEGTYRPAATASDQSDGEPPCPACGTAAPLVEGACSDCGLQLE